MRAWTPAVVGAIVWAAQATAASQPASRTPDRVERLRTWLEAVERHESGEADAPLIRVASWDPETLWRVWVDVGTMVSLVRDPGVAIFTPIEPEPFGGAGRAPQSRSRTKQVLYSQDELSAIRNLTQGLAERNGEDHILKRGALRNAYDRAGSPPTSPPTDEKSPEGCLSLLASR